MHSRPILVALIVAALCATASRPVIAGWPRPAGGPSSSGQPEVLFTFDDGPHETHTASILDTLQKHGVKAIFFWVGQRVGAGKRVDERQELVHRAVREGHLVANHTMTHPNLCQLKAAEAAAEIDDNARIYSALSGLPQILFRTPYGAHCKRLKRMLAERQLDHLHWDIDPQEWSDHDAERTAKFIIRHLDRMTDREVVIMHDTHKVTARALPKVLDWLAAENARRKERGDVPPIRILSGSDLVLERLESSVSSWFMTAAVTRAREMRSTIVRLIP